MRAFLCLPISDDHRRTLGAIADDLRSRLMVRAGWVPRENYHITLRFLGEIDPMLTVAMDEKMQAVVRDKAPFTCILDRLGAFPDAARARVVWAGGEPPPEYVELIHDVSDALMDLGFAQERIDSGTHITLARLKERPGPGLGQTLACLSPQPPLRMAFGYVSLMQSTLTPHGAHYDTLCTWRLGGTSDHGR